MDPSPTTHQQPSASPLTNGESRAVRRQRVRDELIAEIERYLKVVECFRALDCEPGWCGDRS
jgi:hypothetical protein